MKSKVAVTLIVLICLALCAALVLRLKERESAVTQLQGQTQKLAKDVTDTSLTLTNQLQVNTKLEADLNETRTRVAEYVAVSNKMVDEINKVSAAKQAVEKEAKTVAQLLKDKEEKLAKSEARVSELETQRNDLNAKLALLTTSITNLEQLISTTERKLAVSEGDREFLLKELKRMQAEKAELERQFNDLSSLKAQVSKLRSELAIAHRLEFIRYGLFHNMRGAEKLMRRDEVAPQKTNTFNLNVELKREGGARILPATNAPAPAKKP